MNAFEFVRKFGWVAAQDALSQAPEQDDEYWTRVGITINEQVIKNLGIRPIE